MSAVQDLRRRIEFELLLVAGPLGVVPGTVDLVLKHRAEAAREALTMFATQLAAAHEALRKAAGHLTGLQSAALGVPEALKGISHVLEGGRP